MLWHLTDEDLALAQRGDAAATERLYAAALPACARVAASLTGDPASARRAVQRLADRSADQLSRKADAQETARWFTHQTVLMARTEPQATDVDADTLMSGVGGPDVVAYRALVAGLRKLPRQQQEAFVLTHAESWNPRLCAVAMDCSTQAVQTHLDEATRTLAPLAGGHFDALAAALRQVHQSRPVDLPHAPAALAARARRRRSAAALLRAAGWVAIALFVVAVAAAGWALHDRIKT